MFNDTIFETTGFKNIKPRYVIKLKDKFTYDLYQDYLSNPRQTSISGKQIIGRFIENSSFLIFASYVDDLVGLYVYDKNLKSFKRYNTFRTNNDLDTGLDFTFDWDPQSTILIDNKIFSLNESLHIKDPGVISSSTLKSILPKIDEFSNPVLMIITMKENCNK